MPEFADFVVKLREAFGDATIDEAVARGKAGEPIFFAKENGRTVGTKSVDDFNPLAGRRQRAQSPLLRGMRWFVRRDGTALERLAVDLPLKVPEPVRTCR